jgi:hypothetical protein
MREYTKIDSIIFDTYSPYFEIVELDKKTGYQRWGNQKYKRNYWLAYLKIKKK